MGTTKKVILEQISMGDYRDNYRRIPGCPSEATTACCSDILTKMVATNAKTRTAHSAITSFDDIRVWSSSTEKLNDPSCTGGRCYTPDSYITEFGCEYKKLCKLKNTLVGNYYRGGSYYGEYVNADNIWDGTKIEEVYEWVRNNIDSKLCLSSTTVTTTPTAGITGGCIDSNATNFCSTCNADCSNTIGGTDTHCCVYIEEYSLKYTYRFCNDEPKCKGGGGTLLKAGEVYKLNYVDSLTIGRVIKQLKNKLGDLIYKANTVSHLNLVDYGFYSNDNISDSDLEDFATALAIILFGNAQIDNRLKYLDGGDILESSNTFPYSHVTIYTAGAGQLFLGNYTITSPNTKAISARIEKFKTVLTTSIIKNQLNWLAKNNRPITNKVTHLEFDGDGNDVWSTADDMELSIAKTRKWIEKKTPGLYIINDDGTVLRESIIGLESLLIEEPIGLGKLLE